jgi:hypothetical protein
VLPHRIRLRGPWELTRLVRADGSDANLPPLTAHMPALWRDCGLVDFTGRVRHVRRFGLPRRLDEFERVWLTFAALAGRSEIWLNGKLLGKWPDRSTPFEIEITAKLHERNELRIDIESEQSGGGMPGEAALEIRGRAWLTDLTAEIHDERLRVCGTVRGRAEEPLDLYAILDRSTVIQARVEASESGRPFEFVSESMVPEGAISAVKIELVSGSNIWHSAEMALTGR